MVRRCALVIAGVATLLLTACSSSAPPKAPTAGQLYNAAIPAGIRGASLSDWQGHPVSLASLSGKIVVVSDMMTLCQETCPLDTVNVVQAARAVEQAGLGNRIEFLSVTIDPQRDTTSRLAAYRKLYRPAPADWNLATGSPIALNALWKELGVYIHRVSDHGKGPRDWLTGKRLTYDLTHSDELFFFGANGKERYVLDGTPHVAKGSKIPPTLRRFMDADGEKNLMHPDPQGWTLGQELDALSWLAGKRISSSGS